MQDWWQKVKTYWNRLPTICKGTIAICIPLVCLISAVAIHSFFSHRIMAAQQEIVLSNEILGTSQRIAISLAKAESAVRARYSSNQNIQPKLDNLASTTLESSLTRLQQLTRARSTQASQVKLLDRIARSRMQLLQQRQMTDTNSFLANQQFWEIVERLEAQERQLLKLHTRSLETDRQLHTNLIWGSGGIGTIGTVIALRILQQLSEELGDRQSRLTRSQHLIRAMMANVIDGVAIVDDIGKIQSFNPAAVEMFGYSPDEVIGSDWHKLLSPAAEVNQNLLSNPHRVQIQQAMGQRKNGDWFPIELSINVMADDEAVDPLRLERIIIIRDITERQQAAAKLYAQNRQLSDLNAALTTTNRSLVESNRELDRYAYITAHDLKAPLRAIASLSEWIEEELTEQFSTETRSQMQLLRCRVYRLQSLLDSLLEYSRSGRRQNPIVCVDVNSLIAEVVRMLAPPATMTIELRTPMPIFDTRKQPLQQVFSQLIDNAIRHHPTQVGVVAISARDLGECYEFTIADDGDGIDPQYHERIYTIFQTLTARDLRENIGVGLAIVKKILAAEGGAIELDSAVGRGATFKFTWLKQPIVN
jgi:PAS domain S-box-containing protein